MNVRCVSGNFQENLGHAQCQKASLMPPDQKSFAQPLASSLDSSDAYIQAACCPTKQIIIMRIKWDLEALSFAHGSPRRRARGCVDAKIFVFCLRCGFLGDAWEGSEWHVPSFLRSFAGGSWLGACWWLGRWSCWWLGFWLLWCWLETCLACCWTLHFAGSCLELLNKTCCQG